MYGIDGQHSTAIGVVVERTDCVEIIAPWEYAFEQRQTNEYHAMDPDQQIIRYEPGDPEYFDLICDDINRSCALGVEQQTDRPETDCTCAELKVGRRRTGAYNLNPDCPLHGRL